MWLAPNLITLIGVSALVASYATSAAYLPEFAGTAPLWLYFFRCVLAVQSETAMQLRCVTNGGDIAE